MPGANDEPRPGTFDLFEDKYRVPRQPRGIIDRADLVSALTGAECAAATLVVVTAPAGYGKSTLLTQWAELDPRPFAWVSVDSLDNDTMLLVRGVLRALRDVGLSEDDELELARAADADLVTRLFPAVARVLATLPDPIVLVVDDVHLLEHPDTFELLELLSWSLPPGSHLVLSSRTTPPLRLGARRAGRQLYELGTRDLALDHTEATALLDAAGLHLDPTHADTLIEHTEGWAGGLYLAALALRGRPSADEAVAEFTGNDRVFAEYFRDELLADLPDDLLRFLTSTSVLERLCGPLCDAVTEQLGSGELLERLLQSGNLFIVPLDHERRWYRFHHLFRDLLAAELRVRTPEVEPVLRLRASRWLEANGDFEGAVEQAAIAGDATRTGGLLLPRVVAMAGRGRNETIGRWLRFFSDDAIADAPSLAVVAAWYAIGIYDAAAAGAWLRAADGSLEGAPESAARPLRLAIAASRAIIGADGVSQIIEDVEVVRAAGRRDNPWWALASMLGGAALAFQGDFEAARRRLEELEVETTDTGFVHVACLGHLSLIAADANDLPRALELLRRAEREVDEHRLDDYEPLGLLFAIGAYVYQRSGQTDRAVVRVAEGRRRLGNLKGSTPRVRVLMSLLLAETYVGLGDLVSASTMLDEARRALPGEPDAAGLHQRFERVEATITAADVPLPVGPASLTPAELRILEHLPTHLSLARISEHLYVSRNTVKTQAISAYRKLGVRDRDAAVTEARRLGIIPS